MNQMVFSIYDSKAEAYTNPFVAKTRGLAVRMFQELVNQQGHQFNKFPADYTLFAIGLWDESVGVVTATEPENMGTGLGYIEEGARLEAVG